MFRFQYPSYFWLLWLIPILVLCYLYFLAWRRKNLKKIGEASFVKALIKGKISGRLTTKIVLISLAILCLVTALANLQAGGHPEKVERKGLDVMFALDVSNSMLARDATPDRLTKAKGLIYRLLEQLHNDRTGLVVFAGNAYLQVPLTVDYGAMRMLLSSVNPGMIPTQGTNFSEAIQLADKSFRQEDKKNKVVILISDGEDHDESAIEAAQKASKDGAIIYTVGIGSPRGSTIYDPSTGQPKVDRNGNVIITKLNEDELRRIAEATGGRYQLLQNSGSVANNLSQSIQQLGTKNIGAVIYTDYKSYFQYFLGAALLLFLIAWLLPDAKSKKRSGGTPAVASPTAINLLLWGLMTTFGLLSLPQIATAQENEKEQKTTLSFKKNINSGNEAFRQHKYDSAQAIYRSALKQNPRSFEGNFNLGDALYASGKYDASRKSLENSLKVSGNKANKAIAWHNIGNSYMQQKKWKEAANAFKNALLLNPNDRDTKYNLAYAQKMLHKQQQNQKNNKNNQQNKKNKDKKNNQDKKNQQKKDKKDQQNQNKDKQNQQDKQQQEKKQQQGDKDKQQQQKEKARPQMQPSKLTRQQADNILNALNQEEKDLHKKKKKAAGVPVQPEKDW